MLVTCCGAGPHKPGGLPEVTQSTDCSRLFFLPRETTARQVCSAFRADKMQRQVRPTRAPALQTWPSSRGPCGSLGDRAACVHLEPGGAPAWASRASDPDTCQRPALCRRHLEVLNHFRTGSLCLHFAPSPGHEVVRPARIQQTPLASERAQQPPPPGLPAVSEGQGGGTA